MQPQNALKILQYKQTDLSHVRLENWFKTMALLAKLTFDLLPPSSEHLIFLSLSVKPKTHTRIYMVLM